MLVDPGVGLQSSISSGLARRTSGILAPVVMDGRAFASVSGTGCGVSPNLTPGAGVTGFSPVVRPRCDVVTDECSQESFGLEYE
jgi:hypothetical protein